jgi:hypothetical protein
VILISISVTYIFDLYNLYNGTNRTANNARIVRRLHQREGPGLDQPFSHPRRHFAGHHPTPAQTHPGHFQLAAACQEIVQARKGRYIGAYSDVAEQISELCELHKCRSFLYFETKKRLRFAVWVGNYPYGPSFKFAMDETVGALFMNLQGNCLKGSRHVLSFDSVPPFP